MWSHAFADRASDAIGFQVKPAGQVVEQLLADLLALGSPMGCELASLRD